MMHKLNISYNNALRMILSLPRNTHRYWMDVLGGVHISTQIRANMIGFHRKVRYNTKMITRLIYQKSKDDITNSIGSNLRELKTTALKNRLIGKKDDILDLAPKIFKQNIKYEDFPTDEGYRINMLNELIIIRDREIMMNNLEFEDDKFNDMMDFLCIN